MTRRRACSKGGQGAKVEFVKEGLTFTGDNSPMQLFRLSMLDSMASLERAFIRERQREGIELAKKRGPTRAGGGG